MVVVIDEYVEGKRRPRSTTETSVIDLLGKAGVRFIDPGQAEKLRALASGKDLIEGRIPSIVTSLEADYILAGVVEANRLESTLMKGVVAFEAAASLKVIATDSSEITDTLELASGGQAFTEAPALQELGKKLGASIARTLAERSATAATVDLVVATPTGASQTTLAEIERGLLLVPGVKSARVVHQGAEVLKLELSLESAMSSDLAKELDRTRPSGLVVKGFSNRAIRAELRPFPSVRLLLGRLEHSGKHRDLASAAGRGLSSAIASCGCVDLGDGRDYDLKTTRSLASALKATGAPGARTLYLQGSFEVTGSSALLSAEVARASDRLTVATAQKSCPIAGVGSCIGDMGSALAEKVAAFLASHGPAPLPRAASTIHIQTEIGDLFPALHARYAKIELGAGSVQIENRGPSALSNVRLAIAVDAFTASTVDLPIADLAPRATAHSRVVVALDRKKLAGLAEATTAALSMTVSYADGDFRLTETFRQPILIHPRTAIRWSPEESVASFIDPTHPEIIAARDRIEGAVPRELADDPIAFPSAAFRAMRSLEYTADPIHPYRASELDHVQFPLDTLARKRGDCDDLALVYASLLEAAGVRTALVFTKGHVIVAFETMIPIHGAHAIVPPGLEHIPRDGVVWIPVETTKVGGSLAAAWKAASEELTRATPAIVEVEESWKSHPGTNLASGGAPLADVTAADVRREVERVRPIVDVPRAIAGDGAVDHDRRGVLLAKAQDVSAARAEFEASLSKDRKHVPAIVHLANLDLMAGRFKEALSAYERALMADPKNREACLNAVIAARMANDNGALAKHLDRCERHPGFGDIKDYLGRPGTNRVGLSNRGYAHLPLWPETDAP
jgi:tetratricopeptide (TPR) repeat protein